VHFARIFALLILPVYLVAGMYNIADPRTEFKQINIQADMV
jgi:hypothetical protein